MGNVLEVVLEKARAQARAVWRRRWIALAAATAMALLFGLGLSVLPDRYEATARVYVDTQTVLKPLMTGLAFQPDIDEQVRMLARTLISRPNMDRLMKTPDLELDSSDPVSRERVATRLMDQIKVVPSGSGNLYQITYRGETPERARRLVEATVELFVHAGAGAKKRDSQDAGRFIEDQIVRYEKKLVEAENRLKEFKVRNFGVSGVSNQDYFARMSTLSDEVNKLRLELAAAEQSREALRRELAAEEPQLPMDGSVRTSSPAVADLEGRIESQRRQLDDLLRRFTELHPDVVSGRRIIAELESELQEKRAAERSLGRAARAATSPVFQKIRISLAETEAQVASLRTQLGTQQSRLEQVRAAAGRVPQVEAEFAQLNRDYDILRKNYDLMVSRRESALLGVKLDESSQLAEFRLIEPPRVSYEPVFPGRVHLAILAVVLSALVGVLAAIGIDLMRPTLADSRALREFSGRPVLGVVSLLVTPGGIQARRASILRFAAWASGLLVLQVAWLSWIASRPPFA